MVFRWVFAVESIESRKEFRRKGNGVSWSQETGVSRPAKYPNQCLPSKISWNSDSNSIFGIFVDIDMSWNERNKPTKLLNFLKRNACLVWQFRIVITKHQNAHLERLDCLDFPVHQSRKMWHRFRPFREKAAELDVSSLSQPPKLLALLESETRVLRPAKYPKQCLPGKISWKV